MDINKYNINDFINILYDFFYNKNNKNIFKTKPINLNDLNNINNFKLICPESKQNFYINNIFNSNIKFIKKSLNKYYFTRYDHFNCDIILSIYNNDDDYKNINDECNNHMKYNYLLSEFLTYKQTKHIILPIFNIDLKLSYLKPFLNKHLNNNKEHEDDDNILDLSDNYIVKVNINEHFFKKTTLNEALTDGLLKKWDYEHYLSLFFQIIHTLAIIKNKYENFSHNNLILDKISCYILDDNFNNNYHSYFFNNIEYKIPYCGIDIKLDYFDDVTLNNKNNDDVETFFNSFKKHSIVSKYLNIKKNIKILNFILDCINIKEPKLIMSKIDFPVFNKKNNNNNNKTDHNDQITYGTRKLETKLSVIKNQRVINNYTNTETEASSDTETPINNYKSSNIKKSSRNLNNDYKKSSKKSHKKSSKKSSKKSHKRSTKIDNINTNTNTNTNKMANLFGIKSNPSMNNNFMNDSMMMNNTMMNNPMMNNQMMNNPMMNNPMMNDNFMSNPMMNNPMMSNPMMNDNFMSNPMMNDNFMSNPMMSNPMYKSLNNNQINESLNNNQMNESLNNNQMNESLNNNQIYKSLNNNQMSELLNNNQMNNHISKFENLNINQSGGKKSGKKSGKKNKNDFFF